MDETQILLRPDQVDLLRSVLQAVHAQAEDGGLGRFEKQLIKFCRRQVDELLSLLPEP